MARFTENGDFSIANNALGLKRSQLVSSPIYTLVCINEKQQAEALVSVRKFFLILAGAACLFVFTSGWAEVIHPLLLLAACYSLHPQLISANVRQEPRQIIPLFQISF